ncbi:MAG: MFS transporter [Alphaproteobacteria bacterium]|nr:MFS transporter [Alphaproteobacteria bacterium]
MAAAPSIVEQVEERLLDEAGGPARLQIVAVLAGVLALEMGELGAAAAVSDQLKQTFRIDNTETALLLSAVSFAGAATTMPMGILVDRLNRRTILMAAVALWAVAMLVSGTATTYTHLIVTRLFLGAVTAAAWPSIASLTGDYFPARERAGIYGLILTGEMVGVGGGFFLSGIVSSLLNWRWSFFAMVLPSLVLIWVIWRYLPEPQRGGQSWLRPGEEDVEAAARPRRQRGAARADAPVRPSALHRKVRRAHIEPRPGLVIRRDPTRWSWWRALAYLFRLPTYGLLLAAMTMVYFFFAGLRAFGMIYFTQHYHVPRGVISGLVFLIGVGAVAGLVGGGRLAEWLFGRGHLNARMIVPLGALVLALPFFAVGLAITNGWVGIVMIAIGMAAMSAASAPIDASLLDIVHPRLWGRAEGIRTALRTTSDGCSPLLFGAVSGWLGGGDHGLMWTFLLALLPMATAGLVVLPCLRTYPRDIATAAASMEAAAKRRR